MAMTIRLSVTNFAVIHQNSTVITKWYSKKPRVFMIANETHATRPMPEYTPGAVCMTST